MLATHLIHRELTFAKQVVQNTLSSQDQDQNSSPHIAYLAAY